MFLNPLQLFAPFYPLNSNTYKAISINAPPLCLRNIFTGTFVVPVFSISLFLLIFATIQTYPDYVINPSLGSLRQYEPKPRALPPAVALRMALRTAIYAAMIFGFTVDAIPTVAFPLKSQVPPVARISKPFSYTFLNSTFSSTLPRSYTLSNAPSWLFLDSSTRTLSGTPSVSDVGNQCRHRVQPWAHCK